MTQKISFLPALLLFTIVLVLVTAHPGRAAPTNDELRKIVYRADDQQHWPAFEKALSGGCRDLQQELQNRLANLPYQVLARPVFYEYGFCVEQNKNIAIELY